MPIPPGWVPPPVFPGEGDGDGGTSSSSQSTSSSSASSSSSSAACSNIVFGPPAGVADQVPFTPKWVTYQPTSTTSISISSTTSPSTTSIPTSTTPTSMTLTSTTPSSTSTTAAAASTNYPGCDVSVAGFTCDQQCRGYVPCQPWCVDNCAYCFNPNSVC